MKQGKAVFVETHGTGLSDNFTLLFDELKKRGYDIHTHYLKISDSGWGSIIRRSVKLLFDIGNAGVILIDESNSLFGSFRLRQGTRLIQLWHACGAFKKWGFSVADKSFGDDADALQRYSGHRNYSLVTVSGSEVCKAYEEAFGLDKGSGIVRPIGVSRTDVFFDPEAKKAAAQKLEKIFPKTSGKKTVVYLPTFRGSIAKAKGPDGFDPEKLLPFEEEYVFLIKNHPFVKEPVNIPALCRSFVHQVRGELSVEELLMTADVLITDYSSVVFEFALMDKPMIFFAYDYDSYDMERGFYYPYKEFVPGPIAYSMDELTDSLKAVSGYDRKRLAAFRERFMGGCDGGATRRIVEYIEGKS
ncbi:MAG: CDP-glycerol glycerophosphotransferase family protein [Lachnospiraceae bacterium]|nr:CDP-glycerol glycerophosphotransferase family protein [Lachnospiraceae bacterium]